MLTVPGALGEVCELHRAAAARLIFDRDRNLDAARDSCRHFLQHAAEMILRPAGRSADDDVDGRVRLPCRLRMGGVAAMAHSAGRC